MEVFLPIYAASKPLPVRKVAATTPIGENAPPVALPLTFVLTGLLALLTGMSWLEGVVKGSGREGLGS